MTKLTTMATLRVKNLFWTSGIVSRPEEFWGRNTELSELPDDLHESGIAISGPVGIGKSSLLSNMILAIEGFDTGINGFTVLANCSEKDEPWQIAQKLFENFRDISHRKIAEKGINLKWFHYKETTQERDLKNGDYVNAVAEFLSELSSQHQFEYLAIAFDECHQCPTSLAILIRELKEKLEHSGVSEVRFLTAGIGSYLEKMIRHNQGLERAFQKQISLTPWSEAETIEFVTRKLKAIVAANREDGGQLGVRGAGDDDLQLLFYRIGGGHPYLTQLLGSHLVRQENSDPDDYLDVKDLVGGMKKICDTTRVRHYESQTELIESAGLMDAFTSIIDNLEEKNPSRIRGSVLDGVISGDALQWFVEFGFLFLYQDGHDPVYQLTDELLRVSLLMRDDQDAAEIEERELLEADDFYE